MKAWGRLACKLHLFSTFLTLSCPGTSGTDLGFPTKQARGLGGLRAARGTQSLGTWPIFFMGPPSPSSSGARDGALSAPPPWGPGRASLDLDGRCDSKQLPARPRHQVIWEGAWLRQAGASVLTFKCHSPALLIMLGSIEATSDLVPAPRALVTEEGVQGESGTCRPWLPHLEGWGYCTCPLK